MSKEITIKEVEDAVKSLKSYKAPGLDDVTPDHARCGF